MRIFRRLLWGWGKQEQNTEKLLYFMAGSFNRMIRYIEKDEGWQRLFWQNEWHNPT